MDAYSVLLILCSQCYLDLLRKSEKHLVTFVGYTVYAQQSCITKLTVCPRATPGLMSVNWHMGNTHPEDSSVDNVSTNTSENSFFIFWKKKNKQKNLNSYSIVTVYISSHETWGKFKFLVDKTTFAFYSCLHPISLVWTCICLSSFVLPSPLFSSFLSVLLCSKEQTWIRGWDE